MPRSRWHSVIANVLVLLISLTWLVGSGASARVHGRSDGSQTITGAAWAVVANGRNQPVSKTPYTVNWSVTGGTAYDYLQFRNIGTIPIQGFRVSITRIRLTGNANAREILFEQCRDGTWDVANHSCSGSIFLLGRATDGLLTFSNLDLGVNAPLEVRAQTRPNAQSTFETTLSTEISRSQIRVFEVKNS